MPSLPEPSGLILLRVAGLPAAVLQPFASPRCCELAARLEALAAELAAARQALVDVLYPLVNGAPAERRHFLLAVKRDAFNGRTIGRHRGHPHWPEVFGGAPSEEPGTSEEEPAERLLRLEAEQEALGRDFAVLLESEQERERQELLRHLGDPRFRRAIALGSPTLAGQLERLRRPREAGGEPGRREKRLYASLLRYLARAAVKLSPYSTFTPLALGELAAAPAPLFELRPAADEHSRLRVQPIFFDMVAALLYTYGPFRRTLLFAWNATVQEVEPQTYRFLRPAAWLPDEEAGELRYQQDSFLKAKLTSPWVAWLRERLAGGPLPAGQLLAEWGAAFPMLPAADVDAAAERLRRLGLLRVIPPWAANDEHLEAAIAAAIGPVADPLLADLAVALGRLAERELAFAAAADPAAALAALDAQYEAVWAAARELWPPGRERPALRAKENPFFEDVLRRPAGGGPLARVAAPPLRAAAARMEPLLQFSSLFDRRHDFLHGLADLMAERWPDREEVGLREVFEQSRQLFTEWLRGDASPEGDVFDPRGLPALAELGRLRRETRQLADAAVASIDGESVIDAAALAAAVAAIPPRYHFRWGACLLLQPLTASQSDGEDGHGEGHGGARFMLNRAFEGTGRYSSRFALLLDPEWRRRFAAPFVAASRPGGSSGEAFLLDLLSPHGDSLNVHDPISAKLLVHRGDPVAADEGATVELAELRIRRAGPDGWPAIVDRQGTLYVPAHLGGSIRRFTPLVFRFLSLFGPTELRLRHPEPRRRAEGNRVIRERLRLGELVLQRQRWVIDRSSVPAGLAAGVDAASFAAAQRWRLEHGLPRRVFMIEKVRFAGHDEIFKPQYLDFGSPSFLALLGATLESQPARLNFDEMLPTLEMAASDGAGREWLSEWMVEAPALATCR